MDKKLLIKYKEQYHKALFNNVIPFWESHSIDNKFGGYFTSLDRYGNVFDKDKFVWLQARQIWIFSMLYNRYEQNTEWLNIARIGIDFLKRYGMDKNGNWYFALTQDGRPLIQPYNIFSDCFAAMAFGEFALATGDKECKTITLQTFNNILNRKENPKGIYNKTINSTRGLKSFSLPMILANLTFELKWILEEETFKQHSNFFLNEIMQYFLDSDTGLVYENIFPNGDKCDSYEGRLINPGHGIEGMGFVMDVALELGNNTIIKKAVDSIISTLNFSWDEMFGGIYYFLDAERKPPLQLEWDQKLWWVHLETLVSLLKGYFYTNDKRCWEWYERIHKYVWQHFPDTEYAEWFGYLNRRGEVLLPIKGGKWKGCFHVPRALFQNFKIFSNSISSGINF